MKKETVEEVAERFYPVNSTGGSMEMLSRHQLNNCLKQEGFIEGAKWMQERMYSKEDLVQLLNFVSMEFNISNGIGWFHTHESHEDISSKEVLDKWFEQYKKGGQDES
jgi:multimeric flavodoxin WrbA